MVSNIFSEREKYMSKSFMKIFRGLSLRPQTDFPNDPQEGDMVYKLGKLYLYVVSENIGDWKEIVLN